MAFSRVFKNLNLKGLTLRFCPLVPQTHSKFFKMALNVETAYFHNVNEDDKLFVKLLFQDESLGVQKVFSFERNMSESIERFLTKLSGRAQDILSNKTKKKCKKDNLLPSISVESNFYLNGQQIPHDTLFRDIISEEMFRNVKLHLHGIEYKTILNCPMVIDLVLPNTIKVGCPVTPKKILTQCCEIYSCKFIWYSKQKQKKEWIECGSGFSYKPKEEDLGSYLKLICIPMNNILTGPKCEATILNPVEEFKNKFEILQRQKFTPTKTLDNEIRIVTYNLLADIYTNTKEAKSTLYTYCDKNIIDFDYRKNLIFLELEGYNADLLCLQEVDRKFFENYLNIFLIEKGYEGFYTEKEGSREGCAFYYDTNKFEMLDKHWYFLCEELNNNLLLNDLKEKIEGNSKLMERINGISTLIQIAVLKCRTRPNDIIVVGNTHLYFHPDADHIRLLQGIIAFKIIVQKMQEIQNKHPDMNVTIFWCGDFNSTPDCGIYKFMTQGFVDNEETDWKSCPEEIINNVSFSHSLKMSSAYGILPYTNYTQLFKACLDYIYYQTDRIKVKSVVPLPSEEILKKETAIPSSYFPSDHLALIADFKWES